MAAIVTNLCCIEGCLSDCLRGTLCSDCWLDWRVSRCLDVGWTPSHIPNPMIQRISAPIQCWLPLPKVITWKLFNFEMLRFVCCVYLCTFFRAFLPCFSRSSLLGVLERPRNKKRVHTAAVHTAAVHTAAVSQKHNTLANPCNASCDNPPPPHVPYSRPCHSNVDFLCN